MSNHLYINTLQGALNFPWSFSCRNSLLNKHIQWMTKKYLPLCTQKVENQFGGWGWGGVFVCVCVCCQKREALSKASDLPSWTCIMTTRARQHRCSSVDVLYSSHCMHSPTAAYLQEPIFQNMSTEITINDKHSASKITICMGGSNNSWLFWS